MKKTLFGLVTMCVTMLLACCTSEPKLEGEWMADAKTLMEEEGVAKVELVLKFDATNVTASCDVESKIDDKSGPMEIGIKLNAEGAYTRQENEIDVKYDSAKTKIDVYKLDIQMDEETKQMMEKLGMTPEKLRESLIAEKDANKSLAEMHIDKLTIKELTDTQLVLTVDGKDLTFTRK